MLPHAVKGAHTHTQLIAIQQQQRVQCNCCMCTTTTATTTKQANDQSADQTEIKTVTKRNSLRT